MGDLGGKIDKAMPRAEKLGRIADMLEASNIDLDEVGQIRKVRIGQHQVAIKTRLDDGTDEVVVHDLAADSLEFVPTWADGPQWPVVQPAAPTKISYGRRPQPSADGLRRIVLFPDTQHRHRRPNPDARRRRHQLCA